MLWLFFYLQMLKFLENYLIIHLFIHLKTKKINRQYKKASHKLNERNRKGKKTM